MTEAKPNCDISLRRAVALLRQHGLVTDASSAAPDERVGAVLTDSRAVRTGDLFIAYKGVRGDAHTYLPTVLTQKPGLLVVEDPSQLHQTKVPWVSVTSGRAAWTYLAAAANDNPQDKLTMIGITGTNGKTSTVWMTAELLRSAGIPCATIGTLGATFGDDKMITTNHTTPDPNYLYWYLAEAARRGTRMVAMEVSSHAIQYEKLLPIRYHATAFTSFSRDHLDFHPTLEDYLAAKWRLFTQLSKPKSLMAYAVGLPPLPWAEANGRPVSYGAGGQTDLRVASTSLRGSQITIKTASGTHAGEIPYFATHALENFCAAWLVASDVAGKPLPPSLWPRMRAVPGRLERIEGPGPTVIVDYAHTPDALEKTLNVLRPLCQGKLIAVFGCGGDRDPGKRPIMGKIAGDLADHVVVTSDNPRTEAPDAIVASIVAGIAPGKKVTQEVDREKAIAGAIAGANAADTVLVAGRGPEEFQVIGASKLPFDDRVVARRYLR